MHNCILCGKKLKTIIYKLDNMPRLVQHMPSCEDLQDDSGMDLTLFQCEFCGLIQFDCDAVFYYKDVIRAGGFSDTMIRLRNEQFAHLIETYHLQCKKIWEVGCGKGEFLEILRNYSVIPYGIENNIELATEAQRNELNVIHGFAEEKFVDPRGPFDAFISFNYLEHQPDPNSMIHCIYNNLNENGIGLVTVPSFEHFIEKASYYEFMRDHIAYYTEKTLSLLFEINGFDILEASRFNGDTTQIIVQKRRVIELPNFDAQKNAIQNQINEYIDRNALNSCAAAVWGASHQGLTILATLNMNIRMKYIVDSATFKWGKYSPVSHLKIVAPDILFHDNIDLVLIIAPAFSDEIADMIIKNAPNVKHILAIKDDKVLIKKKV